MGVFKDLEKAGKDIEHDVEKIGATIAKDLKKAANAVETGLAKAAATLKKEIEAEEQALLLGRAKSALAAHAASIGTLRSLATAGIQSADPRSIAQDIANAFEHGDGSAAQAVLSNLQTGPFKDAMGEFEDAFKTLTLYATGEIDLLVGIAAVAGCGIDFDGKPGDARMLMDFDASAGVEEGGDLGLALGIWTEKPKDLQGGFFAVTLGADIGVGADVICYLSMSLDPKFIGVVLDLNAGEEAEESIDCGFTLAFKLP